MRVLLSGMVLMLLASGSVADEPKADEVAARVAALMRQFTGPSFAERQRAGKALIEIGEPALEALTKAAAGSDPDVAKRAKGCVEEIEIDTRVALLAQKLLTAPLPEERANAAKALRQYGNGARKSVLSLTEALNDANAFVQVEALACLQLLGSHAKPATDKLIDNISRADDIDETVVLCSITTISAIGVEANKAIPALICLVNQPKTRRAYFAGLALGHLGAGDDHVYTTLCSALKQHGSFAQTGAATAIGRLQMHPQQSVAALSSALHKLLDLPECVEQRLAVIGSLSKFGPRAEPSVSALVKIINEQRSDIQVQSCAILALGNIGSKAAEALPHLRYIAQHAKSPLELRQAANKALEMIVANRQRLGSR